MKRLQVITYGNVTCLSQRFKKEEVDVVTKAKIQLLLAGINQADISRKAHVTHSFVSQVVHGHKKPSKKILKACEDLGLSPELMGWNDNGQH